MFDLGWQAWVLLGGGLLVVTCEILFPSAGALAVVAAACFAAGAWFAWQQGGLLALGGFALAVVVTAPVAILSALKILPRTPMGRTLILSGPSFAKRAAAEDGLDTLIGQRGRAITALRPSGIAAIGERRVDVVTRGSHLAEGDEVRVTKVEGNRVIVERVSG